MTLLQTERHYRNFAVFSTHVELTAENKVVNAWIELAGYMSAMFCVVIDEFCLYLEWLRRLCCVHHEINEFVISIALFTARHFYCHLFSAMFLP